MTEQSETIFNGSFYRAGRRGWVITPAVAGIVALVCLVVGLAVGEEQMPRELSGSTPWFGGALAVCIGLTALAHRAVVTRVRATVRPGPDGVQLDLQDRGEGRTIVARGFMAGWHWGQLHTGRRTISHPVLELAVLDAERKCCVLLREELGAAHRPPAGWPEGALTVASELMLLASRRVRLDRFAEALTRHGLQA